MNASAAIPLSPLLRAEPAQVRGWLQHRFSWLVGVCLLAIVAGAGSYGAVIGSWRDPLQAVYTGIKLPLVILLTTLGNGLINGLLAPLLGLNASFRQSFAVVLMTFAIASAVLGALSPVAWFLVWNTPPLTVQTTLAAPEYSFLQLMLALFVGLAGVLGNVQLLPLLRQWTGTAKQAYQVLLAWLMVNLLLGSQICWILRPFIWEANRPVQFIGADGFQGSFFETIFQAICRLMLS